MWSTRNACAILGLCLLFSTSVAAAGSISLPQATQELPVCARNCVTNAIGHSTCAVTNVTCICTNQALNDEVTACITAGCTVKEALTAKNVTSQLYGVPVTTDNTLIPLYLVFIGLAVVAVIIRIIARVVTHAYFWWDDFSNFFGFIGAAVFTVVAIISVDTGQGKDIWFVPFDNITKILQLFYGQMILYTTTRFFVRGSIILFYLRVFPPRAENKRLGRIVQFTLVFNGIYNLSFLVAVIFQCTPISAFWVQWEGLHQGHCGNANALIWAAAVTGIVYDLWLLALPFPQLLSLNLSLKKKIMGGMMFFVGVAVMIISLIRLKTINEFTRERNTTRDMAPVGLWSGLELDVGVICPCLPSFRLLLRRLLPRVVGTSRRYELDVMSGGNANAVMRSGTRRGGVGGGGGGVGGIGEVPAAAAAAGGGGGGGGGEGEGEGEGKTVVNNTVAGKLGVNGSFESADGRSYASVTGLVPVSRWSGDEERGGGWGRGRGRDGSVGGVNGRGSKMERWPLG